MNPEIFQYTRPTPIIDFDHPAVLEFAREKAGGGSPRERAISLYYAIRDGIRYDPYTIDLSVEGLRASTTLEKGRGWCVAKAVLLAGCCRAMGIPARLGFADVRNHLSTERLREQMKTDVFFWHGYASLCINGAWIKATPAFNIELCERFGLRPLDFDGSSDSIYHPFDLAGQRHMEYLKFRGEYPDVPVAEIEETFRGEYPSIQGIEASFDHDVARETAGIKEG